MERKLSSAKTWVLISSFGIFLAATPMPLHAVAVIPMDAVQKSLDTYMADIVSAVINCVQTQSSQSIARITRDVSELSTLFDQFSRAQNPNYAAQMRPINDAWVKVCQMAIQLTIISEVGREDNAQLSQLFKEAHTAFGPRVGNRPQATAALEKLIHQHAAAQTSEQKKMALLESFMTSWQELNQLLKQHESIFAPALTAPASSAVQPFAHPTNHSSGHGPTAPLLVWILFAVSFGLLALQEFLMKRKWASLDDLSRTAEAAAAGDFSRPPTVYANAEANRLAGALQRVMSVLARSENLVYQLSTLVDSSSEGIISHSLDGRILSWNKGAQQLYGYAAEEAKGQTIAFLLPEQSSDRFADLLSRIKRGEKIQPVEMIHKAKNGRLAHVFLRLAPIYGSTRDVIGISLWASELTSPIRSPRFMTRATDEPAPHP